MVFIAFLLLGLPGQAALPGDVRTPAAFAGLAVGKVASLYPVPEPV